MAFRNSAKLTLDEQTWVAITTVVTKISPITMLITITIVVVIVRRISSSSVLGFRAPSFKGLGLEGLGLGPRLRV